MVMNMSSLHKIRAGMPGAIDGLVVYPLRSPTGSHTNMRSFMRWPQVLWGIDKRISETNVAFSLSCRALQIGVHYWEGWML